MPCVEMTPKTLSHSMSASDERHSIETLTFTLPQFALCGMQFATDVACSLIAYLCLECYIALQPCAPDERIIARPMHG